MRLRQLIGFALLPAVIASAAALHHMNSLLGLIVIAPGYLVQAWLFEHHWALGGAGYTATMIGVSAVFWALVGALAPWMVGHLAGRLRRS